MTRNIEIFGPGGDLSRVLPGFEGRPQQIEMADAVTSALQKKVNAALEAGTGVGKSLGYLIPIAEHIQAHPFVELEPKEGDDEQERKRPMRAVISTGTKALQAQLKDKDLPILRTLYPGIKGEVLVGMENFLSPRRLELTEKRGDLFAKDGNSEDQLRRISNWAQRTETGLRSDLPFEPLGSVWSEINCQSEICRRMCKKDSGCFCRRARIKARQANIIIVNTHLLLSNVKANGFLLPAFDILVVDEAHELEQTAVDFFGVKISTFRIDRLFRDADKIAGQLKEYLDPEHYYRFREGGGGKITELHDKIKSVFDSQLRVLLDRRESIRIKTTIHIDPELLDGLSGLARSLSHAAENLPDEEFEDSDSDDLTGAEVRAIMDRVVSLRDDMRTWFQQTEDNYVYQVAKEGRGQQIVALANPLDVSNELRTHLFSPGKVICTSATLSVGSSMNYFRARVGMDQEGVVEKVLTSPFDYRKNALIYVPKNIPIIQGSATDDNSVSMFATEIAALTAISGGRAMVLCTSFAMLRKLVPLLRERCDGLDVVAQGEDLQRHQMVERLKANPKTILVGSDASFGQGIDLRGDVLQLVVIVRIPFPNPLNPIVEARCDQLGQRWFMDYSVPEAVTSFKQSFGRLIRSSTDIGCVAIMDSRVVRKPYGRIFLSSLPATPICYDIPSVEEFFVGRRNHRGE